MEEKGRREKRRCRQQQQKASLVGWPAGIPVGWGTMVFTEVLASRHPALYLILDAQWKAGKYKMAKSLGAYQKRAVYIIQEEEMLQKYSEKIIMMRLKLFTKTAITG